MKINYFFPLLIIVFIFCSKEVNTTKWKISKMPKTQLQVKLPPKTLISEPIIAGADSIKLNKGVCNLIIKPRLITDKTYDAFLKFIKKHKLSKRIYKFINLETKK